MKKSILVICSVIVILIGLTAFTDKPNSCKSKKALQINFINVSKDTISQFMFEEHKIGQLLPGETSKYYKIDSIQVKENNRLICKAEAFYMFGLIECYQYDDSKSRTINNGKITADVNMFMSCGIGFDMILKKN
tara:strand:+ start:232 stop:633 length:402 start_codon:yes stop_codon:yes gene_type:complete